jgi:hypothetical protein
VTEEELHTVPSGKNCNGMSQSLDVLLVVSATVHTLHWLEFDPEDGKGTRVNRYKKPTADVQGVGTTFYRNWSCPP